MSDKHILKLTESEAVLKCYTSSSTGDTVTISPETDLTSATEVYDANTSKVTIKAIYWGIKANKQLDIVRNVSGVLEGHYYLLNTGFYQYQGFVDNTYAKYPIQIIGDGPFHCMLVLGKTGWKSKIELGQFGQYDNPNVVGS